ncbi:hypothetical protein DSCOOX_39320 [Desulfosarcina ovata subsp. ovata]|uniref:Transposase IS200-like domain-containing protein n=2 Tax=Desulfosarcina ovata TaxID=83564 RepID=A0A5K8ADQ6_9BACT|nr:hypothetical protein DSCOOX_39320 [Desulfosarcina ovata subsp. ovata]
MAKQMVLNDAGKMIRSVWDEIPHHYPGIGTDEFVIMPNHIHGIIVIVKAGSRACPSSVQPSIKGQPQGGAPTMTLPDVVHRFKTMTTKRYSDGVKQNDWKPFPGKLWQRNYWEHIVRDELELNAIREYVRNNPAQWELDRLNVMFSDRQAFKKKPQKGQPQGVAHTEGKPWMV